MGTIIFKGDNYVGSQEGNPSRISTFCSFTPKIKFNSFWYLGVLSILKSKAMGINHLINSAYEHFNNFSVALPSVGSIATARSISAQAEPWRPTRTEDDQMVWICLIKQQGKKNMFFRLFFVEIICSDHTHIIYNKTNMQHVLLETNSTRLRQNLGHSSYKDLIFRSEVASSFGWNVISMTWMILLSQKWILLRKIRATTCRH